MKLYKLDGSPAARAALLGCDIFDVTVELVDVNLVENQHLTPEYLKKNPLHTVPVLEDGDLILHDSHAILMYLSDTYGKNHSMYPKDTKQRALVNQMLFFNIGILFPRLRNITYPAIMEGQRKVPQKKLDDIVEAYDFLEVFLTRSKYLAGDYLTIADVAAITNVTSLVCLVPLDAKKYPKTQAWIKEMEEKTFCKKWNAPGIAQLRELIKNLVDL